MPRAATAKTNQEVTIPAPIGGINTIASGVQMPDTDCVFLYNMIPTGQGLRTRLGYSVFAPTYGKPALTIIPYHGARIADDRLFFATEDGIYDSTSGSGANNFTKLTFTAPGGRGVVQGFTTLGGHFLFYADEINGLFRYTPGTGVWEQPNNITSSTGTYTFDVTKIVSVVSWNMRLWFVEKDSARAWYMTDAGAIAGTVTPFNFGSKFKTGGSLVGLACWTVDGGIGGMNDNLVAVSSAGDVVIYSGDIATAGSFGVKGDWNVGAVPAGRRIFSDLGGDLLIMSYMGVFPISKLLTGATVIDRVQYLTNKISTLFAYYASTRGSLPGWQIVQHPGDGAVMLLYPNGDATEQLVYSVVSKSWSVYRGLPMLSAAVWQGKLYFSDPNSRICINEGYVDNATGTPEDRKAIEFSGLTSSQNYGTPRLKQIHLIRPLFLSSSPSLSYAVEARYNFNSAEIGSITAQQLPSAAQSLWDAALWDAAVWGGEANPGYSSGDTAMRLFGTTGLGSHAAIAFRGSAADRLTLVAFDVVYSMGGVL